VALLKKELEQQREFENLRAVHEQQTGIAKYATTNVVPIGRG
jgi:hypothetical protein